MGAGRVVTVRGIGLRPPSVADTTTPHGVRYFVVHFVFRDRVCVCNPSYPGTQRSARLPVREQVRRLGKLAFMTIARTI